MGISGASGAGRLESILSTLRSGREPQLRLDSNGAHEVSQGLLAMVRSGDTSAAAQAIDLVVRTALEGGIDLPAGYHPTELANDAVAALLKDRPGVSYTIEYTTSIGRNRMAWVASGVDGAGRPVWQEENKNPGGGLSR